MAFKMKGFTPFTKKEGKKAKMVKMAVEQGNLESGRSESQIKLSKAQHEQAPSAFNQKLSNLELYNYYKNKEHITGAESEETERKKQRNIENLPEKPKVYGGTAPLPGGAGLFKAFSKVAKHRAKMNKLLESDLVKKGYKIIKGK